MNRSFIITLFAIPALFCGHSQAAPRDSLPLDGPEWPLNYRLHLDGTAKVKLSDDLTLSLAAKGPHDIAVEQWRFCTKMEVSP